MPTINQLVRKPRKKVTTKTKSPALHRVTNNLKTTNTAEANNNSSTNTNNITESNKTPNSIIEEHNSENNSTLINENETNIVFVRLKIEEDGHTGKN